MLKFELLLKLVFNFVLAGIKLLELATDLKLLTGKLLMQLLDLFLLIVSISLLIDTARARVTSRLQGGPKLLLLREDVIHFALLGQDLI